eukprot:4725362-Karenia_brevis.AAC.1
MLLESSSLLKRQAENGVHQQAHVICETMPPPKNGGKGADDRGAKGKGTDDRGAKGKGTGDR